MSASGREFTDEALNRVLDLWLDGGPTTMADDSLETALRAVAVMPQRRWRGRLVQFSGASPLIAVSLTLAGIAVAVALGIGVGSVLPPAGTDASPTPEASSPPSGSVVYTNTEDGYELTVPASWTPREMFSFDDPSGTMRFGTAYSFGGASPFGALTVSIGSPDGAVNVCAPTLCHQIVAKTIDALDDAVAGYAGGSENVAETAVELSLDGEPARLERIEFGGGLILMGPQFHHLFAFHEGRPIMLSFDVYAYGVGREAVNDIGWVYGIVDSFRFLDEEATPALSPEPSTAAEQATVQTVALPLAGFSIDAPGTWWTRMDSETDARVGGPGGEIEVRLGRDGGIRALSPPGILRNVAASSVADLRGILVAEYEFKWGIRAPAISESLVTVDGVDATRLTIGPPPHMTGPGTSHFVILVRDGQPVIIEWVPDFSSAELFDEILATLRFLD